MFKYMWNQRTLSCSSSNSISSIFTSVHLKTFGWVTDNFKQREGNAKTLAAYYFQQNYNTSFKNIFASQKDYSILLGILA